MKKNTHHPYILPMITAILFFLVLLLALSSCELQSLANLQGTTADAGTVFQPIEGTTGIESPPVGETTTLSTTTQQPPATTTAAPILYYNPLNGLPCEGVVASNRPIALTVKTASGIRIASADIVIEAPTEAADTRLALVGCARTNLLDGIVFASTRPYLAAFANDLFAISVYAGTSDYEKESTSFLYNTIDTKSSPIDATEASLLTAIQCAGYQDTVAGGIALPYSIAKIGEIAKPEKTPSTYVSIPFSDDSATAFTYDSLTKSYTMRTCTALVQDGTPPSFVNVIVLFHDATLRVTKDGKELTLDTDIGGTGYYISQGGVMPILWRRDGETSRLIFTDENAIPLLLNRGKTYIGMTTFAYREKLILN